MSASPSLATFPEALRALGAWARREPLPAFLLAACLATVGYFFAGYSVFMDGRESVARWTWNSWNSENDLEHGWLILPAALYVVWYHRERLAAAPRQSSWAGLGLTLAGVLTFVIAIRTLQARLAVAAFPLICFGSVYHLWGWRTARLVLFPCAFLLFMMPIGFLVSHTVGLQTLTASLGAKASTLLGIPVEADGANLRELNNRFQFEVAGGCSGVRSLTAMTMLAALYVHFTQRSLWRKGVIFCSSLLFALVGNIVRVFSVILLARFVGADFAAGVYHDWSGFIFFPIAVSAMIAFSRLLDRDWSFSSPPPPPASSAPAGEAASLPGKPNGAISYDY